MSCFTCPTLVFHNRLPRVDALHRGLGERDFAQGFDLAWEVRLVRAKILEAEAFWNERGERAESRHWGEPAVVCLVGDTS